MAECIPEDDLLELASGQRSLGDARALEAHLADCAECSGLLSSLIDCAVADARARDLVGRTLGPYRLDGLLGAGAMGEVYRGWDLRLERPVAVKVLPAQLAASPDRIGRLEVEARAAAAIAHPNVVTVYDTGSDDGVVYVVSELIVGESLRSVIDRGVIDRRRALELGLQLARGVAAAHAQGVVHRDLKPSNLIVADDGTLKILDFGLAKVARDRDVDATEPGTLVGTSGYLSPEQARGERADARSDIFAIGAILYELLTGRRAFDGATFAERLSAVLRDMPPAPSDPAGPIVMRCLDKDPRKRFQSAADLVWVLQAHVDENAQVRARPPRQPARMVSRRMFLAGAAAAGAGGLLLGRRFAPAPPRAFVPEYRQLTFRHGRVGRARFTHDGGSIVYSAVWEELPSALYTARLGGGGTRPLDLPPAQLLAVSSRGQVAIALQHHYIDGFHHRGQLALAPLEGGTPRALGVDVQDADFTPDGDYLAVVRRVDGRFRLELPVGTVLLEAGWLSHPRVSPDGTLIACLVHDGPGDDRGDVVIVSRTGSTARTIAAGWSSIDGLAWSANGRALWVSASREGGNNSVRALALDGRELSHVPAAGRLRVHDLARTGTMAITHVSGRLRMMARPPGSSDEHELGLSDVSLVADISADGRTVLVTEFGDVDTARGIYLRASDGTATHPVGGGLAFDLADDDRGVLGLRSTLAAFPIERGQARLLPTSPLSNVQRARWCADGGVLVAAAAQGESPRLWRVARDGTHAPISDDAFAEIHVSPDGRSAAQIAGDRLLVHDITRRGPAHVVTGTFSDEAVCGWASSGREVFVRSKAWPIRVRRVEIATATSAPVFEVTPPRLGLRSVYAFAISANADAYAYSYAQELSRLYSMTTSDRLA